MGFYAYRDQNQSNVPIQITCQFLIFDKKLVFYDSIIFYRDIYLWPSKGEISDTEFKLKLNLYYAVIKT